MKNKAVINSAKLSQKQGVVFFQHTVSIHIKAVFRTVGVNLTGDTKGTSNGLFLRVNSKIRLKMQFMILGIGFAI
jgi:hypothetical protein